MSINFLQGALESLPVIAFSPLALIGYVIAIGAWVFAYSKSANLKIIMKQIATLPEADRKATITTALGEPIPDSITAAEWIVARRHKHMLTAFVVSAIVVLIVTGISIYSGAEKAKATEIARSRIAICEQQIAAANNQWKKSKSELDSAINEINEKIEFWMKEEHAAAVGMVLTKNPDDYPILIQRGKEAEGNINKLIGDRDKIKADLNKLISEKPAPVTCA